LTIFISIFYKKLFSFYTGSRNETKQKPSLTLAKLPQSNLKYKLFRPSLIKDTCNSLCQHKIEKPGKNNKTLAHKNAISVSSLGNPFWLMAIYARLTNTRGNLGRVLGKVGKALKPYARERNRRRRNDNFD